MSILATTEAAGGDRLTELLGRRAARMLTTYAVPCLHYAHWQALWRYRLATWTNETTYGTDRYHCLCATFGLMVEQRLPGARVRRPVDAFGTPFTIENGEWLVYPWRFGKTRSDRHEGIPFFDETGIRSKIVVGGPPGQQALEYEGLPSVPLSNVVFLAWSGNRHEGLTRAFLASPELHGNLLYWRDETFVELDLEAGRHPYGLPAGAVPHGPPSGPERDVPAPPAFDIKLIDEESGIEFDEHAASGDEGALPMARVMDR